jgi:hypothetical protein
MVKANFRQQKRQRELARKERQSEKLLKRGERPPEDATTALTGAAPSPPVTEPKPEGGSN